MIEIRTYPHRDKWDNRQLKTESCGGICVQYDRESQTPNICAYYEPKQTGELMKEFCSRDDEC